VIDRTAQLGAPPQGQVLSALPPTIASKSRHRWPKPTRWRCMKAKALPSTLVDGSTVPARCAASPLRSTARTRTGEALFVCASGTHACARACICAVTPICRRAKCIAVPQSSVLYESGQAYVLRSRRGYEPCARHASMCNITLGRDGGDLGGSDVGGLSAGPTRRRLWRGVPARRR
jgi:hypothetical protein